MSRLPTACASTKEDGCDGTDFVVMDGSTIHTDYQVLLLPEVFSTGSGTTI